MPLQIGDTPFLIQLPDNAPREAVEDDPRAWDPATLMEMEFQVPWPLQPFGWVGPVGGRSFILALLLSNSVLHIHKSVFESTTATNKETKKLQCPHSFVHC